MAKPAKPGVPAAFTVTSGEVHKDNWMGAEASLRVTPADEARTIRITLWNPYYHRAYLNNAVEVSLDGRKVFSDKLHPARSAVIDYVLAEDEPLEVAIKSEACMVPDPLDPRERGVIVKLTQEPVKG
jgi:hypothetical protein